MGIIHQDFPQTTSINHPLIERPSRPGAVFSAMWRAVPVSWPAASPCSGAEHWRLAGEEREER